MAGNTYFWFLGALLQQNIPIYSQDVLKIGPTQISYLNATLALAIGLGMLVVGGYWIHRLHLDELVFRRAAAEGQGLQRLWKARA